MEVPPQLPFDHPNFLASMDCEPYPGLHSVPGTVPPDYFINFPPNAPALFSTHNEILPVRRLPSAMPCPVIRTNFRHDVMVTAEKYAAKFPQIVEKLEFLPVVWQDLYHFWDPVDLYVEDPGFLFHVLHMVIWNAITVRRRIYNRVKAWCHLNIHKLVGLTALTPVKSVLDQHDWHFLGLSMIPAHEITMTCSQLDLQRVEMREMIEQFEKRALEPSPQQRTEKKRLADNHQAPDIHDETFSHVSQSGTPLDPVAIGNHHENTPGGGVSLASQGNGCIALEKILPPIDYSSSVIVLGSKAMTSSRGSFYSSGTDTSKVRQNSQVHVMPAASSPSQADFKVAENSGLGQGILARNHQTAERTSSGSAATKTIAELRDDIECPIPRVSLPGQQKLAHMSRKPVQDFDIGKMYNAEADWTSAANEKRLIGIRIANAYDTATILKSNEIPKVFGACGVIESYRPQISDAKMTFASATGAHAALKYNGKAIDSGPSLIVYLIPVWDNSASSNFGAGNNFENANGGESFHSPLAKEPHPQIAGVIHGDSGASWTAATIAPTASMPYVMSPIIAEQPIHLTHRPLPPVPYQIKSVTSLRILPSNVNRARGQPNPVGYGLNRPRPRPHQQGYRQGLFSQYGPRHAQRPSPYQHLPANQTRSENANQNGPDTRLSTGRDYGANWEPKVSDSGPSQSNRIEVLKQENIKTSSSSNSLADLKKSQNKDVVVTVTELRTGPKQSAVKIIEPPTTGITVLKAAALNGVDTYIAETARVNFVAGDIENNVQSFVDKSSRKIPIVPHADPLLQEVKVSGPEVSRPEVIDELRRLATESRVQETHSAGDAKAGIQRLLETVKVSPTATTVLKVEHSRSSSSVRLEDIEHIPLGSKATMKSSQYFEDGIEVSAEDIRGSAAYSHKTNGGNLGSAELVGASTLDLAVLNAHAQADVDALKGKRAPWNVIEDSSSVSMAFADISAKSNSPQPWKSRNENIHHENATRSDNIISTASADESVGPNANARRTKEEAEHSEVFYTQDEDSRLLSRSRGSVGAPGNMNAKGKKGENTSTDVCNQDSSLSFTSIGDEPGSYATIDDPSEPDQQSVPQTMNSHPSSLSMHSTGSTIKRKKKKLKSRKKESPESKANLSHTTDGGEGNSTMSFASAADVSAQGSSTSLIYSSDPAADINKAAAETTPESRIAGERRIRREDRERTGGRNALVLPNVFGRPHQWPTPGMSLGNRLPAQSFGGQDSLPMMENVWRASGRRDSMAAAGWAPGPASVIPEMTPSATVRLSLSPSQTRYQIRPTQSDSRDSMGMPMVNAAGRASLPNLTPSFDPCLTIPLPPSESQIPESTGSATSTNDGTRTAINVSVTSPSIVDTRKQEPISKAWPTVKQWNGRTFQGLVSSE